MSRLISGSIIFGVLLLLVLGSAVCSTSREEAETAGVRADQLGRELRALESSLIFFLLGLGLGSLGFLFIQHQLKRLRLTQEDRTQVVLAEPAQRDRPSDS